MKLYEHDGKIYEIKVIDGEEIIESPTKPGPGWVQVTPEILQMFSEMRESSKQRIEILKKMLEDLEEELKLGRYLGEDI